MLSLRWRTLRPARDRALPALLILVAISALGSGCASPDEPTARHPIVPQTVQDLQARQQGGEVVLSFTLPSQSTRKEALGVPPAIEIYRGEVGPGGKSPEKASTKLIYTIPGEIADGYLAYGRIVYRDPIGLGELTTAATAGIQRVYEVRTRAARNRASAESNRVVVRIRTAPETVGGILAQVAGQSVTLSWPREASSGYRVYRAEIAPESASAASADASKAVLRMPLVQVAQTEASAAGPPMQQYLDENVELGHAYLYILRRVAGAGPDAVESVDSPPVVVTVLEPVPPPAPQDVEAVVVPATATEPAYVSLSWAISAEAEVAGYVVYRSEQEGVRGGRLNQELAGSPTYRDASAAVGRRYFYTVTAKDAGGLESAPSAPAEAQILPTQP
jgi:hypothetical protein